VIDRFPLTPALSPKRERGNGVKGERGMEKI